MDRIEDLEKLAETCLATAKTLKEYLSTNGHPQPTFDQNGPIFYPRMSPEAEYARLKLREASKTLNELANGPENVAQHTYDCLQDLNAHRYVWYYQVPFAVPHNDAVSYKVVAEKTGTDEKQLRKFIRQLIQIHVFCEPKPGFVAHTASSRALLHPGLSAYTAFISYDNVPIMARQIEAIEKWGHGSQEPNHTAVNLVYESDKSAYETWQHHPGILDRFSRLMSFVSGSEYFSNAHVTAGFDWNSLGDGTVVDVGGNMGHCCIDIARANSRVNCVVQDLPVVVDRAQDPSICVIPEDLKNRITFMSHDFFTMQPVEADAYFLRMIFHDYSDKYCIKILQSIVPAMKPGSRIIIMDQILPPVGTIPAVYDRVARTVQLQMQLISNGVEREYEEWEELIQIADKRLKLKGYKQPPGSLMSVLEVVLEDFSCLPS